MTEKQKLQIRTLRQEGLGYQAIGKIVNLSRDSVRSYCKNHGLSGVEIAVKMNTKERIENGDACQYCAGPITHASTGRPRRFCSEACRRAYWNIHRKECERSPELMYTLECTYCHETFTSYSNKNRKYCCHQHYVLDRYGQSV